MIKTPQLYFKDIDSTFCQSLDTLLDDAKYDKLKEITLIEAIHDPDEKYYVWCQHEGEATEKQICKKSECNYYSSKSGRGVCKYRGKLYNIGNEVTFKI